MLNIQCFNKHFRKVSVWVRAFCALPVGTSLLYLVKRGWLYVSFVTVDRYSSVCRCIDFLNDIRYVFNILDHCKTLQVCETRRELYSASAGVARVKGLRGICRCEKLRRQHTQMVGWSNLARAMLLCITQSDSSRRTVHCHAITRKASVNGSRRLISSPCKIISPTLICDDWQVEIAFHKRKQQFSWLVFITAECSAYKWMTPMLISVTLFVITIIRVHSSVVWQLSVI